MDTGLFGLRRDTELVSWLDREQRSLYVLVDRCVDTVKTLVDTILPLWVRTQWEVSTRTAECLSWVSRCPGAEVSTLERCPPLVTTLDRWSESTQSV